VHVLHCPGGHVLLVPVLYLCPGGHVLVVSVLHCPDGYVLLVSVYIAQVVMYC